MVVPNSLGVYKDSEYKETVTSSYIAVIDKKCLELMQVGMKNDFLMEDAQYDNPSTVAKVWID